MWTFRSWDDDSQRWLRAFSKWWRTCHGSWGHGCLTISRVEFSTASSRATTAWPWRGRVLVPKFNVIPSRSWQMQLQLWILESLYAWWYLWGWHGIEHIPSSCLPDLLILWMLLVSVISDWYGYRHDGWKSGQHGAICGSRISSSSSGGDLVYISWITRELQTIHLTVSVSIWVWLCLNIWSNSSLIFS